MIRNFSKYPSRICVWISALIAAAIIIGPKPLTYAADITLAWTANAESELAGYYLYYKNGTSGTPYDGTGVNEGDSPIKIPLSYFSDPSHPEFTLHGLSDTQTTYLVLTAYDTEGNESAYSNEVSYQPTIAPVFSGLSISGDSSINENSYASYIATASFSDGATQIVTSYATWSDNSQYANINNNGVMNASEVSESTPVTIQASYTAGGVTKTATKVVNILNASEPVTLSSLSISGSSSVIENNSTSFVATATFSDHTTQTVTGNAIWSEDSQAATVNTNGVLAASEVTEDTTVTLQASYTNGGITKEATKVITIVDVPPSNLAPDTPVIVSPVMGQTEVKIPLDINTEPFSDPNNDAQIQSQWQISEQSDFSTRVVDITSDNHLTTFPVPHMVLKSNHQYYVRVRFFDAYVTASPWSNAVEFTTAFLAIDLNDNGIPDVDEVDGTVDFNLDGVPDIEQPQIIKCVRDYDGSASIGIEMVSSSAVKIESLEIIDPDTISDIFKRPADLIFGLFAYRLRVQNPGDTARVRVYFSGEIFSSDRFYKYDTVNGWYDYSEHTTFNDDGQSVTLEVKDGGYGDSDGLANGIIVDPGGIASGESTFSTNVGSNIMGCFIATAAFGTKFEKHVQLLRRFRDLYLMPNGIGRAFVKAYYRYSPPMANFIARHDALRAMVRWSLAPLIAFSWMLLHLGLASTLLIIGLMFSVMVLGFRKLRE